MQTIVLERGATRATVLPDAGGRLHQLEVRARGDWLPLLHAPDDMARHGDEPTAFGCFPMAPWPNRIARGRFTWGTGPEWQVDTHSQPQALHGTVHRAAWTVDESSDNECVLSCDLGGGWPWRGSVLQRIAVHDDGMDLRLEVRAAESAFPAGAGWHPWFRREVGGFEPSVLVDADELYELNGMIPTGVMVPVGGPEDLRERRALDDRWIDACFRGVRSPMQVRWGAFELTMAQSPNVGHAVVYTPAQAFCVEPQTCAIDGFNLEARGIDAGVVAVTPAEPLVAESRWRWRDAPETTDRS